MEKINGQYGNLDAARKFDHFKAVFQKKQYDPVDTPSILKLVGDLTGMSVIDYGCGSGHYSRKLVKTASHVVGVDVAEPMIKLAIETNKTEGISNIDYKVHDCSQVLNLGEFDMVFSSYFIQYAKSTESLKLFLESMFKSLKSKHVCCGVMPNMLLDRKDFPKLMKYGYELIREGDEDGSIQRQQFYESAVGTDECLYQVQFYYIRPNSIEKVFKDVGFINFKWIKPSLSVDYKHLEDHFSDYLQYPAAMMFYAEKP